MLRTWTEVLSTAPLGREPLQLTAVHGSSKNSRARRCGLQRCSHDCWSRAESSPPLGSGLSPPLQSRVIPASERSSAHHHSHIRPCCQHASTPLHHSDLRHAAVTTHQLCSYCVTSRSERMSGGGGINLASCCLPAATRFNYSTRGSGFVRVLWSSWN